MTWKQLTISELADAAARGDAAEVKRLIPLGNPRAWDSAALRWAAYKGHAECVLLLAPVSEPGVVKEVCRDLRKANRCHEAAVIELVMAANKEEGRPCAIIQT
jgi:hypothetical protein